MLEGQILRVYRIVTRHIRFVAVRKYRAMRYELESEVLGIFPRHPFLRHLLFSEGKGADILRQ